MANKSTSISFLSALICILATLATGTRLPSFNDIKHSMFSSSSSSEDSICQSLVESQGYACEYHTVTTEDGYILGLQRIPAGRSGRKAHKPPVLLQHGILIDAGSWLALSPEQSLAFMLADNGFDVWLANTRGTISSRGHKSLSPHDLDYWNWSWDELAAYDLPAFFHYVNNQTGQKLHYVGYSLGTLTAFAAFSQNKLLNMLRSAAMLTPIAYLSRTPSLLIRAVAKYYFADDMYYLGVREFIPEGQHLARLVQYVCRPGVDCSDLLTTLTGPNCCIDKSKEGALLSRIFQPTSTRNLIHLSQMVRSGTITKHDYKNWIENVMHYGQPTPPTYNLSSIPNEIPLFLSHGGNDYLSDVMDVEVLLDDLKNHDRDKLVVLFVKDYAHLDFVFSPNANKVVYNPLLDFFELH